MSHQPSPESYALAREAAESLKSQLEERLIGKTAAAWSCCCGALSAGPSAVVGVEIPSSYEEQTAMWLLWLDQGVETFVPS